MQSVSDVAHKYMTDSTKASTHAAAYEEKRHRSAAPAVDMFDPQLGNSVSVHSSHSHSHSGSTGGSEWAKAFGFMKRIKEGKGGSGSSVVRAMSMKRDSSTEPGVVKRAVSLFVQIYVLLCFGKPLHVLITDSQRSVLKQHLCIIFFLGNLHMCS